MSFHAVLVTVVALAVCFNAATGQTPVAGCPPTFPGYHISKNDEAAPQGCFLTKLGRVIPAVPVSDFTGSVDKTKWTKQGDARDMVKKCGEEAVKNGAKYFGIEELGKCYYGNTLDLSQPQVTPADGCDTFCKWDVGGTGAIAVYEVVPKSFKPVCQSVQVGYRVDATHWGMYGGCYQSRGANGGVFPRSTIVNFKLDIDWSIWLNRNHAGDIIQKCGKEALKKGYSHFGLQYYGDCYMGNTPDLSQGLVKAADCDRHCIWDVGSFNTMVLYKIEDV